METQDQEVILDPATEAGTDDTSQVSTEIDYKGELEAAKAKAEEAQKKLEKAEFTLRKQNIERKAEPAIDPEEIERLIDQKLETKISAVRAADTIEDVDSEIASMTDNVDERDYIKHLYETRIAKSGYSRTQIRDDLKAAQTLANAKKIQKENVELGAIVKAKATMGTASTGSNGSSSERKTDFTKHLTAEELQYMKDRQWSEEKMKAAAEAIRADKQRNR